ncbi:hypothetical protein [Nonomuraea terrae]|nr:hypothetical protein [Nonomuraea terrae]
MSAHGQMSGAATRAARARTRPLIAAAIPLGVIAAGTILSPALADPGGQQALCFGQKATIVAQPGTPTIGTAGPDVIVGTDGPDTIDGGHGDDRICGLEGDDVLLGGLGNNLIDGGPGGDTMRSGPGTGSATAPEAEDRRGAQHTPAVEPAAGPSAGAVACSPLGIPAGGPQRCA